MLTKLAWRNLWRNRRRSLIVLAAIVLGLVTLVLTDGIYNGILKQMLENQIGSHVAHIQIHKKGFNDNKIIQNYLPAPNQAEEIVRANPAIAGYSKRVITFGIISSASTSSGISLVGVEPAREAAVTTIKSSVVEGAYLSGKQREIVIGKRLAEKLAVEMGDKVVVMASALDGQIGSDAFRIAGLYETFSSDFDRAFVYIGLEHAQKMLALGNGISEIVLLAKDVDQLTLIKAEMARQLGESCEVLTYAELIPIFVMMLDLFKEMLLIFYLIIGIATIFGVVNAMLMSVFERIREFGVLIATGMKSAQLFGMILIEALFLSAIGTAVGVGLGLALHFTLRQTGIDLGAFAEGMTLIGASSVVYPALSVTGMLSAITIMPFISVLGAIYPAIKATRLEPVRAIQYV